jgi:hypothetical protein
VRSIQFDGRKWSLLEGSDFGIDPGSDGTELISICMSEGSDGLIIRKELIHPDFFELKTGLAGEILQKFSTYGYKLIIAGDFDRAAMKESLAAFVRESNRIGNIRFVNAELFKSSAGE